VIFMAAFSKFAGFSYLQANNRIDFYVTGNSISWQSALGGSRPYTVVFHGSINSALK